MKRIISGIIVVVILLSLIIIPNSLSVNAAQGEASQNVYRINNPKSGEYLYTTDENEKNVLCSKRGWRYEMVGWEAPTSGIPVYRLFNPKGYHLFTSDNNEIRVLTTERGWKMDNNNQPMFYSGGNYDVYRLFKAGRHLLTSNKDEYDSYIAKGWTGEGVKFKALKAAESFIVGDKDKAFPYSQSTNETLESTKEPGDAKEISINKTYTYSFYEKAYDPINKVSSVPNLRIVKYEYSPNVSLSDLLKMMNVKRGFFKFVIKEEGKYRIDIQEWSAAGVSIGISDKASRNPNYNIMDAYFINRNSFAEQIKSKEVTLVPGEYYIDFFTEDVAGSGRICIVQL